MKSVVLLKLGGSLLTDKTRPGHARRETITRLAVEVAEARSSCGPLVLGHGSGGFGHPVALRHGLSAASAHASPEGISAVQAAAEALHSRVVGELRTAGVPVYSLPPSAWMSDATAPHELPPAVAAAPVGLLHALDFGLVPVVRGDVILGPSGGRIASTEHVFLELARGLIAAGWRVERVIWAGDTPGILDEQGRTLPELGPDSPAPATFAPGGADVTGGMGLKLSAARALAREGVLSVIIDGTRPGAVAQALSNHPDAAGTRVLPG